MWVELLLSVIRHAIAPIITWMVAKGIIESELASTLLTSGAAEITQWFILAIASILPVLWSVRNKLLHRLQVRIALWSNPETATEESVSLQAKKSFRGQIPHPPPMPK